LSLECGIDVVSFVRKFFEQHLSIFFGQFREDFTRDLIVEANMVGVALPSLPPRGEPGYVASATALAEVAQTSRRIRSRVRLLSGLLICVALSLFLMGGS